MAMTYILYALKLKLLLMKQFSFKYLYCVIRRSHCLATIAFILDRWFLTFFLPHFP